MKRHVLIDIVIPTYNEAFHIENCLNSVLNFNKPENCYFNIIVVDGYSTDKTVEIVENMISKHNNITLLYNHNKIQPTALNIALDNSIGDYFMRLDAHSYYPKNYLEECLKTMHETKADNVGGVFVPNLPCNTISSKLVMALTTHKFGVGNGDFRISNVSKEVDTVPYGFFDRRLFLKIGKFDERAYAIEDFEFNSRIRKNGGKIFLNTNIKINYFNQKSIFDFLKKQLLRDGPGNAYLWYIAPYAFALRHAIPLFFFLFILSSLFSFLYSHILFIFLLPILCLYILLSFLSSIQQSIKMNNYWLLPLLPFCFFFFHFIYGLGTFTGLFNILIKRAPYIHFNPNK
jgi:glycosyltransferase involved in cell wall biosynthesis